MQIRETCFVTEYKNKVIGVIMVGQDGRRGYIYHTAVNPEYHHQGIGSKLVDNAINALEKQGFTVREDLIYRDKSLKEMIQINT